MTEKLYAVYRYPENGYRPAEGLEAGKMSQSSTAIHLKNIYFINGVDYKNEQTALWVVGVRKMDDTEL